MLQGIARFRIALPLTLLLGVSLLSSGCVRRRMTVRSNPPGATVYLDGTEIGRTPFSTNFDYYGKREFRLVKDGYETKTVLLPVRAPWYEWIGLDFVSEVLLPGKLTDHKYFEFDMQPDRIVPRDELLARADELRNIAHAEGTIRVHDDGIQTTPPPPGGSLGASIYEPPGSAFSTYGEPIAPAQPAYPAGIPATQPVIAPPADPNTYAPPMITR